jgi:hypothetical protein
MDSAARLFFDYSHYGLLLFVLLLVAYWMLVRANRTVAANALWLLLIAASVAILAAEFEFLRSGMVSMLDGLLVVFLAALVLGARWFNPLPRKSD